MLLALDVGNTNIKCGLFKEDELIKSWRMDTDTKKTSDEYGVLFASFFNFIEIPTKDVTGIILSSVIPSINFTIEHMCRLYFNINPLIVGYGIKTGVKYRYDNPKELGSDRIVNAAAAYKLYGGPCIIVDFGTAMTFGAISADGEFLGGCICPGIKISAQALTTSAAKLPKVEIEKPESVICTNTVAAIQSGIVYGFTGLVDYIIHRMQKELGADAKVIATGGLANVVAEFSTSGIEINSYLTLQGLNFVYKLNR